MLGSLVYVGGMALEEALDVSAADDGARLGDELVRIGYAGPLPCPAAAAPHAYVELHIEQGPILEDEGVDDRRRRRRAGHLVDRGDDHRSVGPRRHHADAACAATPATSPRRSRRSCATSPARSAAPRWPRSAASTCRPNLVNVVPADGHDHRRPAQHRRGACSSRPRPRSPPRSTRLAAAEQVTVVDAARWPASSRSSSTPAMVDLVEAHRPAPRATRRGGCRAAPATTPRCSPGSARRR